MANPFTEFLGGEPRAAYFSFSDRFGSSPRQRNYFQNQFQSIYDSYLGTLGQQARGGKIPTSNFTDFLDAFDFSGRYQGLPPALRGDFSTPFAPPVRWFIQ